MSNLFYREKLLNVIRGVSLYSFSFVILVFLIFFSLEYNTPMHSDDFSMYLRGTSFSGFWEFYNGWGGGFVPYWLQVSLLKIKNHVVLSVLVSLFIVLFLYGISIFSAKVLNIRFNPFVFIIISSIYFIFNPNLGQTTFWIVGMTSYLVPLTLSIFSFLFFWIYKNTSSNLIVVFVSFFVFFTSESSPTISAGVPYTLFVLILYCKYIKCDINWKFAGTVFLFSLLGTSVLLLAPGHYQRMAQPAFSDWMSLNLFDKIIVNLERIDDIFNYFKYSLFIYFVSLFCLVFKGGIKENRNVVLLSLIFFSSFIVIHLSMTFAPYMPPRALNNNFFFLLVSISLVLYKICCNVITRSIYIGITSFFIGFFIFKWGITLDSYSTIMNQNAIRKNIIQSEKLSKGQDASPIIPSYYYIKLLSSRDQLDGYFSGSMKDYYGVKSILEKFVSFDYSLILKADKKCDINLLNNSKFTVRSCLYKAHSLFSSKSTFLISIENGKLIDSKNRIYLRYVDPLSNQINKIQMEGPIKYFDENIYGITLKKQDYSLFEITDQELK
ncbi:hypothetical protein SAMN02745213_01250 [Succinivibrio dextrinosolvens DSM 3072]|uniref:Glucosyl transferase GtrII n=1 Tax=Succinivibrio dextrinosolvens DSM 3072 TaxID=1123324 RepID=A0A1T4VBL2_9GAMM|nr:DUF6056 family protein [Succinivibrio dextrinosolvens]SKA62360.1 hypothetical protein SAMN02745213_01250 [Succinivibrio dextrinosolvens DSM 3072]